MLEISGFSHFDFFFQLHSVQRRDVYGAWEQYLGLEHSDNAPKRSYTTNQVMENAKHLVGKTHEIVTRDVEIADSNTVC